jgi:hypothetical protein
MRTAGNIVLDLGKMNKLEGLTYNTLKTSVA